MKKFLLLALLTLGCGPILSRLNPLMPSVERPNTIGITTHTTDSLAVAEMVDVFQAGYPNEAFVCFYGSARDSTIHVKRATAGAVVYAFPDSIRTVEFPCAPIYEYLPLVGAGHSHPSQTYCELSNSDRIWLFYQREMLFFAAFCPDGTGSAQYQDGRIVYFRF